MRTDCEYQAHAALRHANEIDLQGYNLAISVPEQYLQGKGFRPWLSNASSLKPIPNTNSVAALFLASTQQVYASQGHCNFITLDVRVGGLNVRALLDSGATCSCMSNTFASSIGAHIQPETKSIGGLGGSVKTVGTHTTDVKIRKYHTEQVFQVLNAHIAGYDVLLGQDFWRDNSLGVQFTTDSLKLNLGTGYERIEINQSLANFKTVEIRRDPDTALPPHLKTRAVSEGIGVTLNMSSGKPSVAVLSSAKKSLTKKKIRNKQQIAYRIFLTTEPPDPIKADPVAPGVQSVIDKL